MLSDVEIWNEIRLGTVFPLYIHTHPRGPTGVGGGDVDVTSRSMIAPQVDDGRWSMGTGMGMERWVYRHRLRVVYAQQGRLCLILGGL